MALFRGIQEYIARDANNIAQVEDEGNMAIQYYIIIPQRKLDSKTISSSYTYTK